jgi:mono/diheme cytochrome c family protein
MRSGGWINGKMPEMTKQAIYAAIALTLLLAPGVNGQQDGTSAEATASGPDIDALLSRFSEDPDRFTQTEGEALYRATCQACHMEDGRGDEGAGAHPPLAGNPKMNSRHFLAGVILTGYHGMPRFGDKMSDAQIAAVTNYVRSHFGNDYPDLITPDEVANLRPPEDRD